MASVGNIHVQNMSSLTFRDTAFFMKIFPKKCRPRIKLAVDMLNSTSVNTGGIQVGGCIIPFRG